MSKVLAVFGATGTQGGSVIKYVLNDPELSQIYRIRAITRDLNLEKAQKLKQKIEVVQGDVTDRTSLDTALTGVHTIFAMTMPDFGPNAIEVEYQHGKTIADVAVSKGAQYIIFSTLPSVEQISGGKYTKVTPFDAKAKAEQYIRSLPIKSAFYSPGFFMQNFEAQPFQAPQKAADGTTWVLARHTDSKSKVPFIDAVGDTGKFVGAILAEPERFEGKTFCAATAMYTWKELVEVLTRTTGKRVVYEQVTVEEFRDSLPFWADIFVEANSFGEEFGYFGPGSEELVAWAAGNARGKLTGLGEYFERHPLQLE